MVRMCTIYVISVSMAFGFLACRDPAVQDSIPVTEQAILDALGQYDRAWREQDTATVSSMMTEDYLYFSSRGGVRSRSWLLNDLLGNPSYRMDSLHRSDLQVRLYDDAAVVGSRWHGYGSYEGTRIEDRQRCSLVFVFRNGEPYLAAEHCTDIES